MRSTFTGLRSIAVFEAGKGLLVLLVGCGLLALIHHDLQAHAEALVRHFHLNPASRYPRIFLHAADALTNVRLWLLAAGAAAYALLRFLIAYGLWRQRSWAKWLAAISEGIYLPVEIYELFGRVTWPKVTVLVTNIAIVTYMICSLVAEKRDRTRP
jgi:uncharacterized membrane protein (DUF2068 family)